MSALIEFSEIRLRSVHWANQACFLMKDKSIYAMTRNICFRMGLFFKYGKTTGKLAHDTTTYIIDNQKLLFESCQHNCFVLVLAIKKRILQLNTSSKNVISSGARISFEREY